MTRDNILCLGLFIHEGHLVQFNKDDVMINIMEVRNYPAGDIESDYDMNTTDALKFQSELIGFGYEHTPHYILVASNDQESTRLD